MSSSSPPQQRRTYTRANPRLYHRQRDDRKVRAFTNAFFQKLEKDLCVFNDEEVDIVEAKLSNQKLSADGFEMRLTNVRSKVENLRTKLTTTMRKYQQELKYLKMLEATEWRDRADFFAEAKEVTQDTHHVERKHRLQRGRDQASVLYLMDRRDYKKIKLEEGQVYDSHALHSLFARPRVTPESQPVPVPRDAPEVPAPQALPRVPPVPSPNSVGPLIKDVRKLDTVVSSFASMDL